MKIKSWTKLIASILISQSAGAIGTIFTFDAIPTWYALLNKPSFSPPNWLFGPVWTILYTLIGISLYRIWIKKGDLKLFTFHLFLNSIWSPIFFGAKNLGLAFLVILMMDISLIIIIKRFLKFDKLAAYLLIPYLIWISFASILNLSIWTLNPQNIVPNIFAQDLTFTKSSEDYIFTEDSYRKDLYDLNLKKSAYNKNATLSLKEEFRISLYKFVGTRNDLVKNYLTMIRTRISESNGIEKSIKEELYSKIDPEVNWYKSRKDAYVINDSVESVLDKSKEEDERYKTTTTPIIYLSLSHINLGNVTDIKNKHINLYSKLKNESLEITKLGRADASVFERWFKDIDEELNNLSKIQDSTLSQIKKITSDEDYERTAAYQDVNEELEPAKLSLLKLNSFVKELESTISNKR